MFKVLEKVTVWPGLGQNPSVCRTADGDLLVLNLNLTDCMAHTQLFLHRSKDGGRTWSGAEMTVYSDQKLGGIEGTISCQDDLGFIVYMEGVSLKQNPNSTKLCKIMRSTDSGTTWSQPVILEGEWGPVMPYGKIIRLKSTGELLFPAYAVSSPERAADSGWRAQLGVNYILCSRDEGKTWDLKGTIEKDPSLEGASPSETSIVELPDGRLLAVSRGDSNREGGARPGYYSHSDDGGKNWSAAQYVNVPLCEPRLILTETGKLLLTIRSWPGNITSYSRPLGPEEKEPGSDLQEIPDVKVHDSYRFPIKEYGVFLMETEDDGRTWKQLLNMENPREPSCILADNPAARHTYQAGYGDIQALGGGRYFVVFRQGDPEMPDMRPGMPGTEERRYWNLRRVHLFKRFVAGNIIGEVS